MFPPLRTTGDIPSFSKDAFHDESPTYPSPHTLFFPLDFKYNKGERVCICGASLTDQVPLGISHTLNIFNFFRSVVWSWHRCYYHFTDEEIEAQDVNSFSRATQLIANQDSDPGLSSSLTWVCPFYNNKFPLRSHCTLLPWTSVSSFIKWRRIRPRLARVSGPLWVICPTQDQLGTMAYPPAGL